MKFQLQNASEFGRDELKVKAYNSRNEFPHLSASMLEINGRHGRSQSLLSDRLYLILEGKGTFTVGDDTVQVAPFDVIIVPRGATYDCEGTLRIFMVHAPAYDGQFDVKLKRPDSPQR